MVTIEALEAEALQLEEEAVQLEHQQRMIAAQVKLQQAKSKREHMSLLRSQGGKADYEQFKLDLLSIVSKPPAISTTTLQELGDQTKKRPRIDFGLGQPGVGQWEDDTWQRLASGPNSLEADVAGREGLQTKFTQLLATAPTDTPFELHDVHTRPSVCGDTLKPDIVMALRGTPISPITTGFILDLKRQDNLFDNNENVGKAVTYGRMCLQQLPRSVRSTVVVGLTDLRLIVLLRITLSERGELSANMSPQLPDVKHVLLSLLTMEPHRLHVALPDLGPTVHITGFLGYGATSHVYEALLDGRKVVAKVPMHLNMHSGGLSMECQTLAALQGISGVPTLVQHSCVSGSIITTAVLQPLTFTFVSLHSLHFAFTGLVTTLKDAHSRGYKNRDVRPGNMMVDEASGVFYLVDWGSATQLLQAPFEGTTYYSSNNVLGQVVVNPQLVSFTPQDDLESLVCSAFCLSHPDLQDQLEKIPKADVAGIQGWWQRIWAHRNGWFEAIQSARGSSYTRVSELLQRLME